MSPATPPNAQNAPARTPWKTICKNFCWISQSFQFAAKSFAFISQGNVASAVLAVIKNGLQKKGLPRVRA